MNRSNPPVKDFFASPALSLSLAGVFRNNALEVVEVEDGEEGSGGGGYCGEQAGISGENSGPADRSDDEQESNESLDNNDREAGNKRKRKKYHRHTAEQIREMEVLFKESPHPDEKQRQQLSKQLGLSTRQVKFWFQNRRTQIKAVQERHENSLLKSEIEKLQEENRAMRETIKNSCCPHCGFTTISKDNPMATEEQQLRIENAKLKAEIEKLRRMQGSIPDGTSSPSSSGSAGTHITSKTHHDTVSLPAKKGHTHRLRLRHRRCKSDAPNPQEGERIRPILFGNGRATQPPIATANPVAAKETAGESSFYGGDNLFVKSSLCSSPRFFEGLFGQFIFGNFHCREPPLVVCLFPFL